MDIDQVLIPAAQLMRRSHAAALYLSKEDRSSFLACLEACLQRAKQISRRYETLVVEPGGPEHWHIAQVRALGALGD